VKQEEIEVWQAKDRDIIAAFHELVPESHPCQPALLKIFKRKIKRASKKYLLQLPSVVLLPSSLPLSPFSAVT
jgi:hypothetical protein